MGNKTKVIAVVGQTASGKSELAVRLAKKFNGDVISADSRQIYQGMDIGSNKITKKEMRGVRHHLLGVASPRARFSVTRYKTLADKAIAGITRKEKIPIICGGTGFYIDTLVYGAAIPNVPPNTHLRKILEEKSSEELFRKLKKIAPERAETIERKNKRRLIRAVEIASAIGSVPAQKKEMQYNILMLGINVPKEKLREKINSRIGKWLKDGLMVEVKRLKESGLSWKRIESFGLVYKSAARFLQKKISREEMVEEMRKEIWQYAKRQKTWFKNCKNIVWISSDNLRMAEREVKKFLSDI